jgi:alanyl-tRNA synthetase
MQQHTGQHLLSAMFESLFALKTVSFHLGVESSTIDLETSELTHEQARAAEQAANRRVMECQAVRVGFEDAAQVEGLRKASERAGTLRIVTIESIDRSACCGTHVRSTGEIGPILVRKLEKIRGNVRVEFLCGRRALERARADYSAQLGAARAFSCSLDEVPAMVERLREQARTADKARRKLAVELALRRGAELFAATPADATGLRKHIERGSTDTLGDEERALAQGFTGAGRGVFVATAGASILFACSTDAGVHAGNRLKELLALHGGRGGGNAQLAQGSVADASAIEKLLSQL